MHVSILFCFVGLNPLYAQKRVEPGELGGDVDYKLWRSRPIRFFLAVM